MRVPRTGSMLRWLFEDRATGRIVVGQWPNLALWLFLVAHVLGSVLPPGRPAMVAHVVGGASLVVWAVDEIVRGANPWRRLLGGGVLAAMVVRAALP